MSNYKKDNNWEIIWDALYYNFINKHETILKKNYAIAQQVNNWNNKSKKEQDELIEIANKFLKKLYK
jgi:deoxyribodipyrimidine photolyase-related protein